MPGPLTLNSAAELAATLAHTSALLGIDDAGYPAFATLTPHLTDTDRHRHWDRLLDAAPRQLAFDDPRTGGTAALQLLDNALAALDDSVDGVIASPPVLSTEFPPAGTVIVVGTIIIKIPSPPPVHPRWEEGELLARTHLLAMATRFQAASKMSGIGEAAEDLASAATRLIDAAILR